MTSPTLPVEKVLECYQGRAGEIVTKAWTTAINLYRTLRQRGKSAEGPDVANQQKPSSQRGTGAFFDQKNLDFLTNTSRLLGLTIHHRPSLAQSSNPVTQLDLSLADNKVAMLNELGHCIKRAIVLPVDVTVYDQKLEDKLLREALLKLNKNKDSPGVLSKNIDKDIIVIRSLANLYDAPRWTNLFSNLVAGLPEPLNSSPWKTKN
jgi:hypothetical protein